jgi:uncharacterized membrane protein YjjP (DUF1212 family)
MHFLDPDTGAIMETRTVKLTRGLNLYKLDLVTQLLLKMISAGRKERLPGHVGDEDGLSSALTASETSSMRRRGVEPMMELEIANQEEDELRLLRALEEEMVRIVALPPLVPEMAKDLLIAPLISAGMAVMYFDGPWCSALLSFPLGLVAGLLKMLIGRSNPLVSYLFELFLCLTVGFIAALIVGSGMFRGVCFGTLGLAGIVWYIPGLQLVLAVMELATRDTSAGSSHLVHCILKVLLMGASSFRAQGARSTLVCCIARPKRHVGCGYGVVTRGLTTCAGFGLDTGLVFAKFFFPPLPTCATEPIDWLLAVFVVFPVVGVLHCAMLEASFPSQYLLAIPPAGVAFGLWVGLQRILWIKEAGAAGFGLVVLLATFGGCLPGFLYARLTRRSAFAIVYTALQFVVPGALSLKASLSGLGSPAGFAGSEFGERVLAGCLGCTVGAFSAHILVWPMTEGDGVGWNCLPYR